ncbi:hypothetical protein ACQ4M3_20475 [Leptolyngbya sp. AN03gr2]
MSSTPNTGLKSQGKKQIKRAKPPEFNEIRNLITHLSQSNPTLVDLILSLGAAEVTVKLNFAKRTIIYIKNHQKFSGSSLGKAFSLTGLKSLGIAYDLERDRLEILRILEAPKRPDTSDDTNGSGSDDFWNTEEDLIQAPQADETRWAIAKQTLAYYQFPDALIDILHEQQWLYADSKGNPVFIERTFEDNDYHGLILAEDGFFHPTNGNYKHHRTSVFWIATGYPFSRAVIADDPLEILALYSLDQETSDKGATLYFCARRQAQLPIDILETISDLYISKSCLSIVQKLKDHFSTAMLIDPRHPDSWRGVWREHQTYRPKKSNYGARPVNRQRQLQR